MSAYDWKPKRRAKWRAAPFVIACEDVQNRGRMRGSSYHPPMVLHRPSRPALKHRHGLILDGNGDAVEAENL
jgi:hypothetical protein